MRWKNDARIILIYEAGTLRKPIYRKLRIDSEDLWLLHRHSLSPPGEIYGRRGDIQKHFIGRYVITM